MTSIAEKLSGISVQVIEQLIEKLLERPASPSNDIVFVGLLHRKQQLMLEED